MPTEMNIATAQILSVHRNPYRSSKLCSRNGKAKPATRVLDISDSYCCDATPLTSDTRPGKYDAGCKPAFTNEPLW